MAEGSSGKSGLGVLLIAICLVAGLAAGCEEQFPKTMEIGESYDLEGSVSEKLHALNALEAEMELGNPYFSTSSDRANHFDSFLGKRLYFRHGGERIVYDTVKVTDEMGEAIPGDPYDLQQRKVTLLDTHYVNPEGYLRFKLPSPSDSGRCDEVYALFQLTTQGSGSRLVLDRIRIDGCSEDFQMNEGEQAKERTKEDFEKIVLKALE